MQKIAKTDKRDVFITILVSGVILILLDAAFLYFNKDMFQIQISDVQGVTLQPKYLGFILCYILLIGGLYWFILRTKRPIWEAVLLGFFVYGVYETTNYGTLKKWKFQTMVMDTLWGGVLFGSTTFFTYWFLG